MTSSPEELRRRVREAAREYHRAAFPAMSFVPDQTPIPYAGRVVDEAELLNLIDASLDLWLTTGRFAARFEDRFRRLFGVRAAMLTNSGSSANLLAVSALTSERLGEASARLPEPLHPGDEVITVAAGFPTTVNPIFQNGLVPVFVDVSPPTWNVRVDQLDAALSSRTRAVMLAHTLGNPFDLDAVTAFCRRHGLWLVEDCCDALGSTWRGRPVGSFGHLATVSFYPAHHITMGEGGCVLTDDPLLKLVVESFRDWGRDCWCAPGEQNTCGKRFDWDLGDLPHGYDHKYTYSHVGYNLKSTDLQAAVGLAQLDKLEGFVAARRRNFARLREGLADLSDLLILPEPTPGAEPSWFGFPVCLRPEAPPRAEVIARLEGRRVATRLLFGGNLTKQPAYRDLPHRSVGALPNTDLAMERVFWIGVYPGLTDAMLDHMADAMHGAVRP
jgi:CDP-6-deoxy-D-xylo-4-hexulose-3-dehydrase